LGKKKKGSNAKDLVNGNRTSKPVCLEKKKKRGGLEGDRKNGT